MRRNNCICCGNGCLFEIIDLGMHPYADTFISKDKYHCADKVYPLIVDLCERCKCIQTRYETSPQERYVENNYSYTSSNSKFATNHWIEFAKDTSVYLQPNDLVYEIGCNDGFLLQQYKSLGYNVRGIDASPFMCNLSQDEGLDVQCGIFDGTFGYGINAKLVVANNVLNHSNDPLDFILGVKNILTNDGIFVFELPYWGEGVSACKFDQIYHEHVTYFTEKFVHNLLRYADLYLIKIEKVNYHGVSLRVTCSNKKQPAVADSEPNYFFDTDFYIDWSEKIKQKRNSVIQSAYELAKNGSTLVAIGAAAKGNTFLNYYKLDSSIIKFVTDNSDYKVGKFTPLTRIPIVKDEELKNLTGDVHGMILSWNISDIIKKKLLDINPNIRYFE